MILSESGGRSPRARGSPGAGGLPGSERGSIPAGTGKPAVVSRLVPSVRVDPRGHGEAAALAAGNYRAEGRSPRARGSRLLLGSQKEIQGSIPAGTGKPPEGSTARPRGGVDPRGHGEAVQTERRFRPPGGRSPRARGSPFRELRAMLRRGSIPAGTGKPTLHVLRLRVAQVDPRGHGEATGRSLSSTPARGRSPRARGSRPDRVGA